MKIIASLEASVATGLVERFRTEMIPTEVRTVTQDSGLDFTEIQVQDDDYERACKVAQKWDEERVAEAENRSKWSCGKCGSKHISMSKLGEDHGFKGKCKNCGCELLF